MRQRATRVHDLLCASLWRIIASAHHSLTSATLRATRNITSRYYFGEKITDCYLLAEIISARGLGIGMSAQVWETYPRLSNTITS